MVKKEKSESSLADLKKSVTIVARLVTSCSSVRHQVIELTIMEVVETAIKKTMQMSSAINVMKKDITRMSVRS